MSEWDDISEHCHASLKSVAPDWFFDNSELSPFGSEAGRDALLTTRDWYASGGTDAQWSEFLDDETDAWGLGVDDEVYSGDPADAVAWIQDGGEERVLQSDAQRRVATSLAQWFVTGAMTHEAKLSAAYALLVQRVLLERFCITYPDWELADEAQGRLAAIMNLLRSAPLR